MLSFTSLSVFKVLCKWWWASAYFIIYFCTPKLFLVYHILGLESFTTWFRNWTVFRAKLLWSFFPDVVFKIVNFVALVEQHWVWSHKMTGGVLSCCCLFVSTAYALIGWMHSSSSRMKRSWKNVLSDTKKKKNHIKTFRYPLSWRLSRVKKKSDDFFTSDTEPVSIHEC